MTARQRFFGDGGETGRQPQFSGGEMRAKIAGLVMQRVLHPPAEIGDGIFVVDGGLLAPTPVGWVAKPSVGTHPRVPFLNEAVDVWRFGRRRGLAAEEPRPPSRFRRRRRRE